MAPLLKHGSAGHGFGSAKKIMDYLTGCREMGTTINLYMQVMSEEEPFVSPGQENFQARQLLFPRKVAFQLIAKEK